MSQGANVDDLDVFRSLKAALVRFKQTADSALLNSDAQVLRTVAWLEGEQLNYWQGQIRKRSEAVVRAKEAVRQKKLFKDSAGRFPSAALEEKILQASLKAVEEAEARLAATKRAGPKLQKEFEAYRGSIHGLGTCLVNDIPKAIAMVERAAMALEEYVNLASSTAGGTEGSAPSAVPEENMGQGGESREQASPKVDGPDKEGGHVST